MYGYIYLTENLLNGKKYIGQHRCAEFDTRYYGSGVLLLKAIQKYGKQNFKTTVLCECFSEEELNEQERKLILDHNAVNSSDYYNISDGGSNGNGLAGKSSDEIADIVSRWKVAMNNRTESEKQKTYKQWLSSLNNVSAEELALRKQRQSDASSKVHRNRTVEEKEIINKKISEGLLNRTDEEKAVTTQKHISANNKMWEEMTPEKLLDRTRKYKETRSKQTEERRNEISENARRKTQEQMSNMTEEDRLQRSIKVKETWKNKSEFEKAEFSRKCSEQSRGKIWITNGETETKIFPDKLEIYLSQGYIKARKKSYLRTLQALEKEQIES